MYKMPMITIIFSVTCIFFTTVLCVSVLNINCIHSSVFSDIFEKCGNEFGTEEKGTCIQVPLLVLIIRFQICTKLGHVASLWIRIYK